MSQPPPPPRRRSAPAPGEGPIVIYPGNAPGSSGSRGDATRDAPIDWQPDRPRRPAGPPQGPRGPRGNGGGGGRGGGRGRDDRGGYDRGGHEEGDGRRRWLLIGGGLLAVVIVVVGAMVLFGGGGGDDKASGPEFEASTSVDLKVGAATVESVGFPVDFPAEAKDQVLTTIGAYVDNAVVAPLRKGTADDAAITPLFDAGAAARLVVGAPDRQNLIDEGFPKAVGKIDVTAPPVALTALEDRDGTVTLVGAVIDLNISARAEKGTVKIRRAGTFVFAPDGTGAWKITAWSINVIRSGPGVTPPTTAPAVTPTTTPAT